MKKLNMWKKQKELVLARLESTNPNSKIILGNKVLTARDLIKHVKKEDEFGKNIVNVQIRMIQTLADVKDIKKMEREGKIDLSQYEKLIEL
ncbi:MAG: hypothetical protein AABY22_33295 [Nanoarchaeota archaeon]